MDFALLLLLQPKRCRWIGGTRHAVRIKRYTRRRSQSTLPQPFPGCCLCLGCGCPFSLCTMLFLLPSAFAASASVFSFGGASAFCRYYLWTWAPALRRRQFAVAAVLLLMSSVWWAHFHGNGHRTGEASNPGPGRRSLKIGSMNVTSLRLHLSEISQLDWDTVCIQETGCNASNFHSATALCHEAGIELFHGPPSVTLKPEVLRPAPGLLIS